MEAHVEFPQIQEELLEIGSQVEVNSFSIVDIKKKVVGIERAMAAERFRASIFRVASLLGIVLFLCSMWWGYFELHHQIEDLYNKIISNNLPTKSSNVCNTIQSVNSDN